MTGQDHNEAFEKIIAGLNYSQREAVETIEGPVLVIAGPGTGKTHILAARIGKILMETDAQAHNILCLTFTEAGVRSMRRRLIDFIGPEAHRVHVFTFHGFCNKVIRENLEIFGRKELEAISDLERIELLQKLIDELPLDHKLRRGRGSDIYFYIPHLTDLFAKMKSEHWSPDFVCRKAEEYLQDLPNREEFLYKVNRKEFKKGDLKQSAFDKEADRMELLTAGAKLFPAFLKKMEAWRRYDFNDMILWTLDAFAKNPNLLRTYQEQYLYFLVDEFQDTNGAQNEILQNLITYWENPNVFIVGDDDQSIYEFQGARLKNLTDFYEQYFEHLKLVVLGDNYRSSQTILDTSGALIARNKIRITTNLLELGIDKNLTAQNSNFADISLRPNVKEYPFRFHEAADVVNQIEAMKNEDFPLEEIAVIYAKHQQSEDLIELFNKKGIPYNTRKKINLLDLGLVSQIRMILEYLSAENTKPFSGESRLFKILHFPFWETDLNDLARLSLFFAKARKEKEYFWKEAILSPKLLAKAGIENGEKITKAGWIIKDLQKAIYEVSVPHLIEKIFNKTGLLAHSIAQPDKAWEVQILHTFLSFVKNEVARNPRIDLPRLLDLLKSMDDNKIALALQKVAQTEAGVNLLTAHGSKGLEFQRVFILDATADIWEPKKRGNNFRFSLPDTVTYSGAEDETEARRRLFYVAMTRAKEQLHISYSRQNNQGKELQRAIFVDEILQGAGLQPELKELPEEEAVDAQITLLSDSLDVKIVSPDPAVIEELLADFQMSVSALNNFIYCPLGFYYENVLRVPSVQREAASYGSAMHEALEKTFKKMLAAKPRKFPGMRVLVKDFEEEMEYQRGFFSERSFEQRLRAGRHHLKAFYRKHAKKWSKNAKIELRITNVEIEGVPVVGVIDRLDYLPDMKVHIVDYKTSKPKAEHLRKPTPKKPEGGNYWRQLIFYKLLFENYKNTEYRAISAEISYLEPDKSGEYLNPSLTFSPKEIDAVRVLIKEAYAKIMAQDFYKGCGKPECNWCNFVREQKTPATFSREEIEGLDDL